MHVVKMCFHKLMTFRIWGEILDCIEIVALNEDQGISFINEKLNDQIKVQQK